MAGRTLKPRTESLVSGAMQSGAVAQLEGLWLNLTPSQKEWLKKKSKGAIGKLFRALEMKLDDLVMADKQGVWLRSRTTVNAITQSAVQMMQLWHLAEGGVSMKMSIPEGKVQDYLERVSALRERLELGGEDAEALADGVLAVEGELGGFEAGLGGGSMGKDDPDGVEEREGGEDGG